LLSSSGTYPGALINTIKKEPVGVAAVAAASPATINPPSSSTSNYIPIMPSPPAPDTRQQQPRLVPAPVATPPTLAPKPLAPAASVTLTQTVTGSPITIDISKVFVHIFWI
jgi:hypothetical protein